LLVTGEIEGALGQFNRVLATEPDNLNAHYNLGRALVLRADLAGAIAHFEQAVRIDPGDALSSKSLRETRARLRRANQKSRGAGHAPTPLP
jgi:tetratricopeptide (TPR) repeat protein